MNKLHIFGILAMISAVAASAASLSNGNAVTPNVSMSSPGKGNITVVAAGYSREETALGVKAAAVDPVTAPGIALVRHDVAVTTVDPLAIQAINARSGVPNKSLTLTPVDPALRKGRLFVFIGGTGSTETITQEMMYTGARRGYNSIAIAYPNDTAVTTLCLTSLDSDCTAKVREEILTGVDLSPLISIAPRDCLETRLKATLAYLRATYPAEGWDEFLNGDEIDWSKISAVGHSQGAGHVAYLAKLHSMFRAVMISGVSDISVSAPIAPWLYRPNVTPVDRQYGFTSVLDYVVPLPVALASWSAIGLPAYGLPQPTDGLGPDYGGSHQLTTALLPKSGTNAHVSMLDDATMPRNADGTPAFAKVWEYMAFP